MKAETWRIAPYAPLTGKTGRSMRGIFITLIVFGCIPLVFKRPWIGILLFSWISYMNPHRLTYGFAYSFQFALIAAVVTIIAFIIGREPKKIPATPVSILLFMFILWTSLTTITALAPEEATARFIEFVKIQLMTVLTLAMVNTKFRLNWLIVMIVFSIGFYGVRGGIFSIMTGGNYRVWGPEGSFFEDNNQLALTLIMTMPMMHYLQLIATNRWVRHLLSVIMVLTLGAIIGTYSRGALLALSVMGMVLWLRSSKKLPVAFAAVICIAGVLSFMPQKWFDRMDTINSYDEDESASGRFDAWLFAINLANDRVLGGGFKVNTNADLWPIYNPESPKVRAPHSIYFEVMGEHGYVGLTFFMLIGLAAFMTCAKTHKLARGDPNLKWASDLSKMMQVSLVGYAAAGTFLNVATFDLYYHVLAIVIMTRVIVKKELQQAQAISSAARTVDSPDREPEPSTAGPAEGSNVRPASDQALGGASGYLIKRR